MAITDACGKLGFDDDMLLDKVTTRLLGAIPEMDAAELHTLVRRPLGLLWLVQRACCSRQGLGEPASDLGFVRCGRHRVRSKSQT